MDSEVALSQVRCCFNHSFTAGSTLQPEKHHVFSTTMTVDIQIDSAAYRFAVIPLTTKIAVGYK